jgi:ribosomal protein S18 acetylase RimI-like enzyme
MELKPLQESDYDTVHRIFKQVFDRTKWEEDFFTAWRKRNVEGSLGAYSEDGRLLAYAITTTRTNDSYWFLEFLAADPTIHGKGVGTALLQSLLHKNSKIQLVPVNNDKLIHWYKKHGFEIIAEKKDKWGDPELIMSTISCNCTV